MNLFFLISVYISETGFKGEAACHPAGKESKVRIFWNMNLSGCCYPAGM